MLENNLGYWLYGHIYDSHFLWTLICNQDPPGDRIKFDVFQVSMLSVGQTQRKNIFKLFNGFKIKHYRTSLFVFCVFSLYLSALICDNDYFILYGGRGAEKK